MGSKCRCRALCDANDVAVIAVITELMLVVFIFLDLVLLQLCDESESEEDEDEDEGDESTLLRRLMMNRTWSGKLLKKGNTSYRWRQCSEIHMPDFYKIATS